MMHFGVIKNCCMFILALLTVFYMGLSLVYAFGFSGTAGGKRVTVTVDGTWQGTYAAGTTYAVGDIVLSAGINYKSLQADNVGHTPASNATWWQAILVKGDTGATGAQGEQGIQGFRGYSGATGAAGSNGAAATLTFANISTLSAGSSASATNLGTNTAANLVLRVPRGATGTTGATGAGVGVGTDGTYGWFTNTNTVSYTDCLSGRYGLNYINGVLYQCLDGTNAAYSIALSSLGTGTPSSSTYLRGDGTWSSVSGGGGGTSFQSVQSSILRNMSSGRLYDVRTFSKQTLPAVAGNQSIEVFANTTSVRLGVGTSGTTIHDIGGATTTAGFSAHLPKGSFYRFFTTAADSVWYAVKQVGSSLANHIQEFIASLGLDSYSTDHGNVVNGSDSAHVTHTLTNSEPVEATGVTFTTYSSVFRNLSSSCGSTLAASSNCTFKTAFIPSAERVFNGHIKVSADGLSDLNLALLGTGIASVSYLVNEEFETGGTPTNWTALIGAPFGFTPALVGSYSINVSSSKTAKSHTFTATGDVYAAALIQQNSGAPADYPKYIVFMSAVPANLAYVGSAPNLKITADDSFSAAAAIVADTPLYIKVRYQKGTGTNAITTVWTSSTGAAGTWTQKAQKTNGTHTADAVAVKFTSTEATNTATVDSVRVSNSDINY